MIVMNTKIITLIILLACSITSNIFCLTRNQKEMLYALHQKEQDFALFPAIIENIDDLIEDMRMSIQVNEKKLELYNQKKYKALINGLALIVSSGFLQHSAIKSIDWLFYMTDYPYRYLSDSAAQYIHHAHLHIISILSYAIGAYVGLNIYDTFKTKKALQDLLETDKCILDQLEKLSNKE